MDKKVLLTVSEKVRDQSATVLQGLKDEGWTVDWRSIEPSVPEEVLKTVKGYDAVIVGTEPYTAEVIEGLADRLRIISRFGIGIDAIDIEAATKNGIAVANTTGKNAAAVAEAALTLMLCAARGTCLFDRKMRAGQWWRGFSGSQLEGKTVGIIGFGHIGQKLAGYLRGFSCELLRYDVVFNEAKAKELSVRQASLEEIVKRADYISLHVPMTPSTRNMVDRDFLSRMKSSAVIVNTSRGGVINEKDLSVALKEKRITGAALDVFEKEPLDADSPFRGLDNVILTPHVASNTGEGIDAVAVCAVNNVLDIFEGKTPETLLNTDFDKHRKG